MQGRCWVMVVALAHTRRGGQTHEQLGESERTVRVTSTSLFSRIRSSEGLFVIPSAKRGLPVLWSISFALHACSLRFVPHSCTHPKQRARSAYHQTKEGVYVYVTELLVFSVYYVVPLRYRSI